MIDTYLIRTTRQSEPYKEALLYKILGMLNVDEDDGEITQDVRFDEEINPERYDLATYTILFKDDEVGKLIGEVKEDGLFEIKEIV